MFNHTYWFPVVITVVGLIIGHSLEKIYGVKPSEKKRREQRAARKKAKQNKTE